MPEPNKVVAALLAFFLGCFGAHKFHLGKTGMGVLYLICGTIGWLLILPGVIIEIVSFVEFIMLLAMKDSDFHAQYSNNTAA